MLEIQHLQVQLEEKEILSDLTLSVHPGKFTLLWDQTVPESQRSQKVLAGHPSYKVTKGSLQFFGKIFCLFLPKSEVSEEFFFSFNNLVKFLEFPINNFFIPFIKRRFFKVRIKRFQKHEKTKNFGRNFSRTISKRYYRKTSSCSFARKFSSPKR